jgi:hypothetical protein
MSEEAEKQLKRPFGSKISTTQRENFAREAAAVARVNTPREHDMATKEKASSLGASC